MIGHTPEFAELVRTSHEHRARVRVFRSGAEIRWLRAHAGYVEMDRNNKFVRRFTATVADPEGELTPEGLRDLLAPFGTYIKIDKGMNIPVWKEEVLLVEVAEDWDAGQKFGMKVNESGYLEMV